MVVAVGALFCLGMAVLMACVPEGETFFRHTGKWIAFGITGVGGLWLAGIAVRGDARQIDKALDEMSSGL